MVGALNNEWQLKQLYALMGGRFHHIKELFKTKEDSSKSCLVNHILHEFFNKWTSNPSFRAVMKKLVETKDTINMASAGLPKGEAAVDLFWAEAWVHSQSCLTLRSQKHGSMRWVTAISSLWNRPRQGCRSHSRLASRRTCVGYASWLLCVDLWLCTNLTIDSFILDSRPKCPR